MGNALGISAFVLLLLSVPIPLVGTYVTFLALLIATGAALSGEKIWTLVTTIISAVKVFFLSPTWHLAMFGAAYMHGVNHALEGAANSNFSAQYGDAGTRSVLAASQAGMEQSANAMAGTNTVNLLLTIAFLAAPVAALVLRATLLKPPSPAVPVRRASEEVA